MMVVLFAAVVLWPASSPPLLTRLSAGSTTNLVPETDRFACEVAYVNDGDTFRCVDGTRVRLHAVAARESDETCSPGHPCPAASAASAKAALEHLVSGQTLFCDQIGKSYNRLTAICWTPTNRQVNCEMVRSGTAVIWNRFNQQVPIC